HQHPDLRGRDWSKRELSPDLVVSCHTTAGHSRPRRSIPVLHVESSDAIEAEGLRQRRLHRVIRIVLLRDDIDLADGLTAIEADFNPITKTAVGIVEPQRAVNSPARSVNHITRDVR